MLPEKKIREPRVGAYLRADGGVYIHAVSYFKGMISMPTEPYLANKIEDNPESLGQSILLAKEGCLSYFLREDYRDYKPPYLAMAGVKSHRAFGIKTKFVIIYFFSDQIKFGPNRNEKAIWYGIPDKKKSIPLDSSPEALGTQLLESFEDSII